MSYSIAFWNIPPEIKSPLDIPADFKLPPLGSETEVLAIFAEVFPEAEVNLFTDKRYPYATWLTLSGENFALMFSVGKDEAGTICDLDINNKRMDDSFEKTLELLGRLWKHTGWRAFDTSEGMFISFDAEGLQAWENARCRIIEPAQSNV